VPTRGFADRVAGAVRRRVTRAVHTHAIPAHTRRLIVVLTPGHEVRSGGVMVIADLYRETLALTHLHHAWVAICTAPGDPPLIKYSWFPNENYLLDVNEVIGRCRRLDHLLLHIPEYLVNQVAEWLTSASRTVLRNVRDLQLNVLLQNLESAAGQDIAGLQRFGATTCTTAHEGYTTRATRDAVGVPLHRLSTCNGPEFYTQSTYQEKEDLLMVSPDAHPLRTSVLDRIRETRPDLRMRVVQNLAYQDYRALAGRVKWSLTFGEGLDAYFVDPVLSGAVSFAVFNDRYFTPAFSTLPTVYPSWDALMERLPSDLDRLSEPGVYGRVSAQAQQVLSGLYDPARFRDNLQRFYRGDYTYP
jgi:hypothetical protein